MSDANRVLVEQIFHDAQFIRSLGIELISFGKGWCKSRVNVSPALRQQHGFGGEKYQTCCYDTCCHSTRVTAALCLLGSPESGFLAVRQADRIHNDLQFA